MLASASAMTSIVWASVLRWASSPPSDRGSMSRNSFALWSAATTSGGKRALGLDAAGGGAQRFDDGLGTSDGVGAGAGRFHPCGPSGWPCRAILA